MASIGQAARLSGVGIETIRYYERAGVVPPAPRGPGGRRVYGPDAIARLRLVRSCRALGLPLATARALAMLAPTDPAACDQARAIAARHLGVLRQRLADLAQIERLVAGLLGACRPGDAPCPVLHSLQGRPGTAPSVAPAA
jgi:MerR family mercuric resistance operon transcriptional regulator